MRCIRFGTFETNSSSCHVFTYCSPSVSNKLKKGEVVYWGDSYWDHSLSENEIEYVEISSSEFYNAEQLLEAIKSTLDEYEELTAEEFMEKYESCSDNYCTDKDADWDYSIEDGTEFEKIFVWLKQSLSQEIVNDLFFKGDNHSIPKKIEISKIKMLLEVLSGEIFAKSFGEESEMSKKAIFEKWIYC